MTIKRYETYVGIFNTASMAACDDGDYVYYDDHVEYIEKKDAQIECLKQMIRDMQHNQNFDFAAASEGVVE